MNTPVILIVNSERAMLSMLRKTLAYEGYFLLPAQNGRDALEILEQHRVDLVLADDLLPDMNGAELLDRVRMNHPSMLTMMLTSSSNVNVARMTHMNVGIYKFFLKPCNPDHLRTSIRRSLSPHQRSLGLGPWTKDVWRAKSNAPTHSPIT